MQSGTDKANIKIKGNTIIVNESPVGYVNKSIFIPHSTQPVTPMTGNRPATPQPPVVDHGLGVKSMTTSLCAATNDCNKNNIVSNPTTLSARSNTEAKRRD